MNGRAKALEYLHVFKPFKYDDCYKTSLAGKPLLQHGDTCTVSCRSENGFTGGGSGILYKCMGATGLFALVDVTTGFVTCAPSTCQVANSLCPMFVGKYRTACEFLTGRGAVQPFVQDPKCLGEA